MISAVWNVAVQTGPLGHGRMHPGLTRLSGHLWVTAHAKVPGFCFEELVPVRKMRAVARKELSTGHHRMGVRSGKEHLYVLVAGEK